MMLVMPGVAAASGGAWHASGGGLVAALLVDTLSAGRCCVLLEFCGYCNNALDWGRELRSASRSVQHTANRVLLMNCAAAKLQAAAQS